MKPQLLRYNCYFSTENDPIMDDNFVVYKDKLFSLLGNCSVCGMGCMKRHTVTGTALTVKWHCDTCDESHQWDIQPRVNKLHGGNIQLSASIMFSGVLVSKVLCVCGHHVTTYIPHPCSIVSWAYNQPRLGSSETVTDGQQSGWEPAAW